MFGGTGLMVLLFVAGVHGLAYWIAGCVWLLSIAAVLVFSWAAGTWERLETRRWNRELGWQRPDQHRRN